MRERRSFFETTRDSLIDPLVYDAPPVDEPRTGVFNLITEAQRADLRKLGLLVTVLILVCAGVARWWP